MTRILLDIFNDPVLSKSLAFKGGTAAMFFYDLPRFSTDLDFNCLQEDRRKEILPRLQTIVERYGAVFDVAEKFYGPVIVLDYGKGERKLKLEVSYREFDNHYEMKTIAGVQIPVMTAEDMFTHKLCAFSERKAGRDAYDIWYFLDRGVAANPNIIRERTLLQTSEFFARLACETDSVSSSTLMSELGEVVDEQTKTAIKTTLIPQLKANLELFSLNPLLSKQAPTARYASLSSIPDLLPDFVRRGVEASMVPTEMIKVLSSGTSSALFLPIKAGGERRFVFDGEHLSETPCFREDNGKITAYLPDGNDLVLDGVSQKREGFYVVKKDGRFNYVSESGAVLCRNWLDSAGMFRGGRASCALSGHNLEIDASGIVVSVDSLPEKKGRKI